MHKTNQKRSTVAKYVVVVLEIDTALLAVLLEPLRRSMDSSVPRVPVYFGQNLGSLCQESVPWMNIKHYSVPKLQKPLKALELLIYSIFSFDSSFLKISILK